MSMAGHTLCNTEAHSKEPRDDDGEGTKAAGRSCEPPAAAAWITKKTAAVGPNSPDLGCRGNGERARRAANGKHEAQAEIKRSLALFFMPRTTEIRFLLLVACIQWMLQRNH